MIGYWIAAALSAIAFLVHLFVGSREITRPLLESAIDRAPKYTVFLCWHIVSLTLAALTAGFVWAALDPAAWQVGVFCTGLSAGIFLWSLALQLSGPAKFAELPQWTVFLAAACAGGVASLQGGA